VAVATELEGGHDGVVDLELLLGDLPKVEAENGPLVLGVEAHGMGEAHGAGFLGDVAD